MYTCESWTIMKAECQRIDAFKLWCWRRLLRVSWTPRRSSQPILKEINSEYSLEGQMVKLRLQCTLEKTLMLGNMRAGKEGGDRGWRWLDGIIDSIDMSLSKFWEIVKEREAWSAAVHGVTKSWTHLWDWTAKINLLHVNNGLELKREAYCTQQILEWC